MKDCSSNVTRDRLRSAVTANIHRLGENCADAQLEAWSTEAAFFVLVQLAILCYSALVDLQENDMRTEELKRSACRVFLDLPNLMSFHRDHLRRYWWQTPRLSTPASLRENLVVLYTDEGRYKFCHCSGPSRLPPPVALQMLASRV